MKFMITARFDPQIPLSEIAPHADAERARIAELISSGELENIYLGEGRKTVFLVVHAASQIKAQQILDTVPMCRFLHFEWQPLEETPYP